MKFFRIGLHKTGRISSDAVTYPHMPPEWWIRPRRLGTKLPHPIDHHPDDA
jgi:hypothetical protein